MPVATIRRFALVLTVMAIPTAASAQNAEQDACDAAFTASDVAVKGHKLVSARDQLRVCGRSICGSRMSDDCSKQLAALESRIPAIVLRAENAGQPTDASVLVDGKQLVAHIDGRSVDLDPGAHTFTFVLADGRKKDVTVTVSESDKGQKVTAIFDPPPSPPPPMVGDSDPPKPESSIAPNGSNGSLLRTTGFVIGGAGIVGLGVGAIFGLRASGKKNDADCDAANECDATSLADARSAATVSTIGFVAGGVLLAGGLALVIFAPSSSGSASASSRAKHVRVTPTLGANGGGLTVMGGF